MYRTLKGQRLCNAKSLSSYQPEEQRIYRALGGRREGCKWKGMVLELGERRKNATYRGAA